MRNRLKLLLFTSTVALLCTSALAKPITQASKARVATSTTQSSRLPDYPINPSGDELPPQLAPSANAGMPLPGSQEQLAEATRKWAQGAKTKYGPTNIKYAMRLVKYGECVLTCDDLTDALLPLTQAVAILQKSGCDQNENLGEAVNDLALAGFYQHKYVEAAAANRACADKIKNCASKYLDNTLRRCATNMMKAYYAQAQYANALKVYDEFEGLFPQGRNETSDARGMLLYLTGDVAGAGKAIADADWKGVVKSLAGQWDSAVYKKKPTIN